MSPTHVSPNLVDAIEEIGRETQRAIRKTTAGSNSSQSDMDYLNGILKKYTNLLMRVARKNGGSLQCRLKRATTLLLDAPETKVCALLHAFGRCKQTLSLDKIKVAATQLRVWKPLPETVRARLDPRSPSTTILAGRCTGFVPGLRTRPHWE